MQKLHFFCKKKKKALKLKFYNTPGLYLSFEYLNKKISYIFIKIFTF
jgi:hypothetical protein